MSFVAGDAVPEQIADHRAKEKPPEIKRAIESIQPKRFDGEASLAERFCGSLDSGARLRSCDTKRFALQNSDAHSAQLALTVHAQRNRRGECIACVRSSHHFEE